MNDVGSAPLALGLDSPLLSPDVKAPTIAAAAVIFRLDKRNAEDERVFEIQDRGARPPLIIVDAGPHFRLLASNLGPAQPVYGAALPNRADLSANFTFQEIASHLIDALDASGIPGPYCLAGWSMAGVIAYEMAQQLRARGEVVPLLIFFDTSTPKYLGRHKGWKNFPKRLFRFGRKVLYRLGQLRQKSIREAWGYYRERTSSFETRYNKTLQRLGLPPSRLPFKEPLALSWEFLYRAGQAYEPKPYEGPMVLFLSNFRDTRGFQDPQQGWGELARSGLQVIEISSDHDLIFFEPVVSQLASLLTRRLKELSRTAAVDGAVDIDMSLIPRVKN
jgi:thioesterase domain-containing protein